MDVIYMNCPLQAGEWIKLLIEFYLWCNTLAFLEKQCSETQEGLNSTRNGINFPSHTPTNSNVSSQINMWY